MLLNLKSSLLVSSTLPVAVLMCFIAMRYLGVDANIVALSGIAIAIGTMVDMGIVLTESIVARMEEAPKEENLLDTIYEATTEVASAIITAVATTVISFLPVFTMQAAEGKLFRPLAYTKTFALIASIIVAITLIPPLAHSLFSIRLRRKYFSYTGNVFLIMGGLVLWAYVGERMAVLLMVIGIAGLLAQLLQQHFPDRMRIIDWAKILVYAGIVAFLLTRIWMPLGVEKSLMTNLFFVSLLIGGLLGFFSLIIHFYESILRFLLQNKFLFLALVGLLGFSGVENFSANRRRIHASAGWKVPSCSCPPPCLMQACRKISRIFACWIWQLRPFLKSRWW